MHYLGKLRIAPFGEHSGKTEYAFIHFWLFDTLNAV